MNGIGMGMARSALLTLFMKKKKREWYEIGA